MAHYNEVIDSLVASGAECNDVESLKVFSNKLVFVIRKLAESQESMLSNAEQNHSNTTNDSDYALQAARKELADMKEARSRTEALMLELIRQRDRYRELANDQCALDQQQTDPNLSPFSRGLSSSASSSPTILNKPNSKFSIRICELESESEELRNELSQANARIESLSKVENTLQGQLKQEESKYFDLKVQLEAEVELNKQISKQLTTESNKLADANNRLSSCHQLLAELQVANSHLKISKESTDTRVSELESELHLLKDNLSRSEVQFKIAQMSEEQLRSQLDDCKEDRRLSMCLAASIETLETGLRSKTEQNKQLIEDLHNLQKKFEEELRNRSLLEHQLQRKISSYEADLKQITQLERAKTSELQALQTRLAEEESHSIVVTERAKGFEEQLLKLMQLQEQARRQQVYGSSKDDGMVASNNSEALEEALLKIENLTIQLQLSENDAKQFKAIGGKVEQSYQQLQSQHRQMQLQHGIAMNELQTKLDELQFSFDKSVAKAQQFELQLQKSNELSIASEAIHKSSLEQLQQTIDSLRMSEEMLLMQIKATEKQLEETIKEKELCQQTIASQQEKVLQIEGKLSESVETNNSLRNSIEKLQTERIELQNKFETFKKENELKINEILNERKELQTSLKASKLANDLLSSQVMSLGTQVDRLTASRNAVSSASLSSASASASTSAVSLSSASLSPSFPTTNASSSMSIFSLETFPTAATAAVATTTTATATTAADYTISESEAVYLKQLSELREVLQITRLERDMLEGKVVHLEGNISHLNASLTATQHSLSQSRNDLLKDVKQQKEICCDPIEFDQLLQKQSNWQLLQESISQLNAENRVYSEQLTDLENKLRDSQLLISKQSHRILSLESDLACANSKAVSLERECSEWKKRLDQLVDRYGDVDPIEYRKLKEDFDAFQQQSAESLACAKAEVASWETKYSKTVAELSSLKSTYASLDNNSTVLRERFREFKKTAEGEKARLAEEVSSLKSDKDTLELELADSRAAGAASGTKVDSLEAKLVVAEAQISELKTLNTSLLTRSPSPTPNTAASAVEPQLKAASIKMLVDDSDSGAIGISASSNAASDTEAGAGASIEKSIRERLLGMKRNKQAVDAPSVGAAAKPVDKVEVVVTEPGDEAPSAQKRLRIGSETAATSSVNVIANDSAATDVAPEPTPVPEAAQATPAKVKRVLKAKPTPAAASLIAPPDSSAGFISPPTATPSKPLLGSLSSSKTDTGLLVAKPPPPAVPHPSIVASSATKAPLSAGLLGIGGGLLSSDSSSMATASASTGNSAGIFGANFLVPKPSSGAGTGKVTLGGLGGGIGGGIGGGGLNIAALTKAGPFSISGGIFGASTPAQSAVGSSPDASTTLSSSSNAGASDSGAQ